MPSANPLPRHVCPECEGHPGPCDACDSTGRRLCDFCKEVRAADTADGTALCLACLSAAVSEMEEDVSLAVSVWRKALHSATAHPSEKRRAYAIMQTRATQLAGLREQLQAALEPEPANDAAPAPAPAVEPDWRGIELRVGFGLVFGQIAKVGGEWVVRWQSGTAKDWRTPATKVHGPTAAEAIRLALAELFREQLQAALATERPALAR